MHTTSGKLPFSRGILHAVTMEKPGHRATLGTIDKCLDSILNYCNQHGIKSATLPILGTGTGRLPRDQVLDLYTERLSYSNTVFHAVHYNRPSNS